MKPRRFLNLLTAAGLAVGALVAVAPPAQASTPVCEGLVGGLDADNHVVSRHWKNGNIESEKKSAATVSAQYLTWLGSQSLAGGGSVSGYVAFRYDQAPQIYHVTTKATSSTLSVKYIRKFTKRFKGRLVTTGGGFGTYAVDGNGNLRQWTRYADDAGRIWLDTPKTVATNMGGLKTLSYSWTFKIDGVYTDVLYGTTASGKLLQFQIPIDNPTNEKITRLASGGFGAYDWISPAGCNGKIHYAALVAIDHETNSARLFTLPSQTVPKAYRLADRGPVGEGADWNLHAVG